MVLLLSAVAISDAGFARLWLNGFKLTLPGPFGWWLQFYWGIRAYADCDDGLGLVEAVRVHPVVLGGAALLWINQWIATELSPTWKAMMGSLVNAWGWRG